MTDSSTASAAVIFSVERRGTVSLFMYLVYYVMCRWLFTRCRLCNLQDYKPADCQATCRGKNGRRMNARLTEHKQATKDGNRMKHIAKHHRQTKHEIISRVRKLVYELGARTTEPITTVTNPLKTNQKATDSL